MKPLKTVNVFSVPIAALTMEQTIQYIGGAIQSGIQVHHCVVNAGKIVMMQRDKQLYTSVVQSDLINADGQAVVWAARFLGTPVPERVAGIDLMEALAAFAHKHQYKIFLLGAKEEVVTKVKEVYSNKYSPGLIVGTRNGYFGEEDESSIAKEIADSGAQLLFVAITSPKKENFLYRNKTLLSKVNFIMGVGGSFDVVAGITQRAPKWMQQAGLEWFFRLIQEPRRMWHRYTVVNAQFIWIFLKDALKRK
jgi:N-acetylglucosaminyldiphosphoundecaprenol N-acetyl-beta-D-mannosaminyltransferase